MKRGLILLIGAAVLITIITVSGDVKTHLR
jgi:hypothetical protein